MQHLVWEGLPAAGAGDGVQTRDKQGVVEVGAAVKVVEWVGPVEREEFPVAVSDEVETAEERHLGFRFDLAAGAAVVLRRRARWPLHRFRGVNCPAGMYLWGRVEQEPGRGSEQRSHWRQAVTSLDASSLRRRTFCEFWFRGWTVWLAT